MNEWEMEYPTKVTAEEGKHVGEFIDWWQKNSPYIPERLDDLKCAMFLASEDIHREGLETIPINISKETISEFCGLCYHSMKKHPFGHPGVKSFYKKTREILENGCFKHGVMTEKFYDIDSLHSSVISTIVICPKCSPKEYKRHKEEPKCSLR